jgi:hypothetical protein
MTTNNTPNQRRALLGNGFDKPTATNPARLAATAKPPMADG